MRVGVEQGERLRRLVEQLLDLSRLDARGISVNPVPLVLSSVLGEIVAECSRRTQASTSTFRMISLVVADRLVLERVISNLLINAVRYGAEPIMVTAEQRRTHLRITVEDSGEALPRSCSPRLFERFVRTESVNVGTGLGLAIARTYARAHGGDLVHDPGARGARFSLIIPQGGPSLEQQVARGVVAP